MTIGGNTGVDKNVLSLNGRKVANVGHGEVLSVSPNAAASNQRAAIVRGGDVVLHQNVSIDASGVNPEGYTKALLGIVRRETGQAIAEGNRQVLRAVPSRMGQAQTLGS